jgi:hypothetical protein
MSLYRQTGLRSRRTVIVALVAGLVGGAIAGLLIGRASESEPSLAEQVEELRARAQAVPSALELVTIEYREAVRGGAVVAPTEYQATVDAANRARQVFAEIRPEVEVLDPAGAAEVQRSIEELARLVEDRAASDSVERASRAAAARLRATLGETA